MILLQGYEIDILKISTLYLEGKLYSDDFYREIKLKRDITSIGFFLDTEKDTKYSNCKILELGMVIESIQPVALFIAYNELGLLYIEGVTFQGLPWPERIDNYQINISNLLHRTHI